MLHVLVPLLDGFRARYPEVQLELNSNEGIIDLIEMDADIYYDDLGKDIRVEEIPDDLKEKAEEYHQEQIGRAHV